ncbi:hypothetical protein Moror_4119 [Moniliophthora roreri MCA 2997]|uniref:Uncharacterized protein n=1 Tax=Moniliophthora roreri (strain MCA 2997) TaxID=1381753 RepID=V2YG98_MONRO|nr:hypothetical protein Moror_4119 [Moniliophthora roreri MCA 2997]
MEFVPASRYTHQTPSAYQLFEADTSKRHSSHYSEDRLRRSYDEQCLPEVGKDMDCFIQMERAGLARDRERMPRADYTRPLDRALRRRYSDGLIYHVWTITFSDILWIPYALLACTVSLFTPMLIKSVTW